MTWLKQLFFRRRLYSDLSQEIREHLEERIDELVASGMSGEEATHAARREFGNVTLIEDRSREVWRWSFMEGLLADIRYALRTLRKTLGFTAVVVLSLALGIGANTAIFTLLDALLLCNLPVLRPDRLVELSVVRRNDKITFSFPMVREIERGQKVFSSLMGWNLGEMANVEANGLLGQAGVRTVTGNYFSELGATPLIGRLITPEDAPESGSGGSPVAVLSYPFWQGRFGGNSGVIGTEIEVEGKSFTIVGVTRKWFAGMTPGEPPDLTIPIAAGVAHPDIENRAALWLQLTGRLRDGVTLAQAQAQIESFWPAVLLATASTNTPGLRRQMFLSMGLDVASASTGFARELRARFARPLFVLLGIVALILLVACINVANLTLARSAARNHEASVRLALGAGRWSLARQVLAESLALSVSGGLSGLVLAYWGSHLLVVLMTEGYLTPVTLDLRPDWRVLLVTAAVAVLTGVVSGLGPAWRYARQDPGSILQRGSRSLAGGMGNLGRVLMVTQVALSLVLLLGASLLVGSFQQLSTIPTYNERVLEVGLNPRPGGYENLDLDNYHRQLIERASAVPGVLSVGLSDRSITGRWQDTVSSLKAPAGSNGGVMATEATVSPGFFETLGIGLVRGRNFDDADDLRHPHVAIISRGLSDRLFPSDNPLGQRIRFSFMPQFQNLEIVGVADNIRLFDLRNAKAPVIYLPYLQYPGSTEYGFLLLRARQVSKTLVGAVQRAIESVGREYPGGTQTVAEEVSQALVEDRAVALLSSFFAGLALLLVSVGLYGLMSHNVTRRTREIGVRNALGAKSTAVLWLVLGDALGLVLAGIVVGVPCALAASRLIGSTLFGISASDPMTLASACLLLLAVAGVAGYIPARRATKVDPMVALRYE